MKIAATSILLRYISIGIQFAVVLAVAQNLPLSLAGQYFSVFGIIAVAFTLSGLGIPDGCVKAMNEARASGDISRLRALLRGALPVTLLVNVGIASVIGVIGVEVARLPDGFRPVIALWWFGSAGTFLFAQVLVGAGRPVLATFYAYSSINIMYALTLVPALVFMDAPSLMTVMSFAAGAANAALLFAGVIALRTGWRLSEESPEIARADLFTELSDVMRSGMPMMMSRLMQASLPWIPVWLLGYFQSPDSAAIYAAASRLTVAVTSVVASLRFSMRGEIVAANSAGRFEDIAALNRAVSKLSALPPVAGLVFLLTLGSTVVPFLLGAQYEAAVPVLIVLMFGTLGEAFGGLSDEILKMTGRNRIVIFSLSAAILCQLLCGALLFKYGPIYIAVGTVLAFALQYTWQVVWLSRNTQIVILPFLAARRGTEE
ncbi:lipopolysaccharide biosynthesis protein [Celeribacter sp. ULVN23_4]